MDHIHAYYDHETTASKLRSLFARESFLKGKLEVLEEDILDHEARQEALEKTIQNERRLLAKVKADIKNLHRAKP